MTTNLGLPTARTSLGLPAVPPRTSIPIGDTGISFGSGHHFTADPSVDLDTLVANSTMPLSVIMQITKRCDFGCTHCSETLQMPDPTLAQLETMRDNLKGVGRVFLSGGEPLLRNDFGDVVDMFADGGHVLAIPTNATRGKKWASRLVGKVAFMNVGLEGPRSTTKRVRGDYDTVIAGMRAFQEAGLPLSLSSVIYRSTLDALPFLYQIGDVFDAGKIKLIMPLRKGNALDLAEHEFITNEEAVDVFNRLNSLRATHQWTPALRLTSWTPETEGHMIAVEPNGRANAWPVYGAKDLFEPIGNLLEEPATEVWARYRFKRNHFAKYLGRTIQTVEASRA